MPAIRRLVFDIETAGANFDDLDEVSRNLLDQRFRRQAKTEEEFEKEKERLAFYAPTSQIIAIGMLDADSQKGAVYFQGSGEPFEEEGVKFEPGREAEILNKFWQTATYFEEFITFGGRIFDAPMLMTRSAIHNIRPSKNLMINRYLTSQPFNIRHIDLQDQLGFYGAKDDRLGLHFWCMAFGIPSPKAGEVTGEDVTRLFHEGKGAGIARYCLDDVKATAELFRRWESSLRFA